ncbi:MAG: hypothetical protein QXZ32_02755 [Desulfurococcaceae archaeon]
MSTRTLRRLEDETLERMEKNLQSKKRRRVLPTDMQTNSRDGHEGRESLPNTAGIGDP